MNVAKIELCGAFNARVTPRKGETAQQAAKRAEDAIQKALDTYCRRYDVRIGVDFGALQEAA